MAGLYQSSVQLLDDYIDYIEAPPTCFYANYPFRSVKDIRAQIKFGHEVTGGVTSTTWLARGPLCSTVRWFSSSVHEKILLELGAQLLWAQCGARYISRSCSFMPIFLIFETIGKTVIILPQ